MPKVTGPAFSLDAKGSLKKTITYQKRPSGSAVFPRSEPGAREPFTYSYSQLLQRENIRRYVAAWRALSQVRRDEWDDLAKALGRLGTGYHLYIHNKGINPTMVHGLQFGNNQYVDCGGNASVKPDAWTLEFWFRTLGGVNRGTFDWGTNCEFRVHRTLNRPILMMNAFANSRNFHLPAITFNDTWHHMAVYIPGAGQNDIDNAHCLLDGARITEDNAIKTAAQKVKSNFRMGRPAPDSFDGGLAEVRLWNVVLDDKDVVLHSQAFRNISTPNTAGCNESNLIGHWKMLEGSGLFVHDSSENGNTGRRGTAVNPKWITMNLQRDIYGIT